jgi:hypothetical protein
MGKLPMPRLARAAHVTAARAAPRVEIGREFILQLHSAMGYGHSGA